MSNNDKSLSFFGILLAFLFIFSFIGSGAMIHAEDSFDPEEAQFVSGNEDFDDEGLDESVEPIPPTANQEELKDEIESELGLATEEEVVDKDQPVELPNELKEFENKPADEIGSSNSELEKTAARDESPEMDSKKEMSEESQQMAATNQNLEMAKEKEISEPIEPVKREVAKTKKLPVKKNIAKTKTRAVKKMKNKVVAAPNKRRIAYKSKMSKSVKKRRVSRKPANAGAMRSLKKSCNVRKTPNGVKMSKLSKGKKLWVEGSKSGWYKVYRKSGPAYISSTCF